MFGILWLWLVVLVTFLCAYFGGIFRRTNYHVDILIFYINKKVHFHCGLWHHKIRDSWIGVQFAHFSLTTLLEMKMEMWSKSSIKYICSEGRDKTSLHPISYTHKLCKYLLKVTKEKLKFRPSYYQSIRKKIKIDNRHECESTIKYFLVSLDQN